MHVRIIDANSIGYAQHHANDIRSSGEMQTQAIAGFLQHIRKNLQYDPSILNVVVWDGRAQWRYDMCPEYKSGRHRTPEQRQDRENYETQRPWIQRALTYFPVIQVKHPQAEADDMAWGLAQQLSAQGHLVTVFTADQDWLQMVNSRTRWVNARHPLEVVELDGFHKSCGFLSPLHVAQIKALTGDRSDDIEGLPDIAEKRAAALLTKYGSLDALFLAAEDFLTFSTEPKYCRSLMLPESRALVTRNLQLVDLSRAPALNGVNVEMDAGEFDELNLFEIFVDLKFLQWQDGFDAWKRVLEKPMLTPDVMSVRRAIASLAKSWDK